MSRPRVRYATVYVLPPAGTSKQPIVSTTPEHLYVRRGEIVEWTVVNGTGQRGEVTFQWDKPNPLEGQSLEKFTRRASDTVRKDAKKGVYKYSVFLNGRKAFDPEIEIMP